MQPTNLAPGPLLDFPGLLKALEVAVWWNTPEEALASYPWEALFCHILVRGLTEDRERLLAHCGEDAARHALARAPAGKFSPAQWTHWNQRLGISPALPLPQRFADVNPPSTPPWG